MPSLSEQVAALALDTFASLPKRCKPRILANGQREWTPLSSIALSRPCAGVEAVSSFEVKMVSLATGTKSLPVSALPMCNGLILHDSHAEILAFRGFNYWLLCEMQRILTRHEYCSSWLELLAGSGGEGIQGTHFRLKSDVKICLFTTEAPCGDASMDLLITEAKALGRDISPWSEPNAASTPGVPLGRGCFDQLGALRRKPARADAEVSMSRSCTDKIMLKQFTGVISFPVDLLMQRSDLSRMIVYEDQYDSVGYERAFGVSGRLRKVLAGEGEGILELHQAFGVEVLPKSFRRFEFAKQRAESHAAGKAKSTNTSAVWIAGNESADDSAVVEVLVHGVKQGYIRTAEKPGKGSILCRRKMLEKAKEITQLLQGRSLTMSLLSKLEGVGYSDLKALAGESSRQRVKRFVLDGLGGWPDAVARDDFVSDAPPFIVQSDSSYLAGW